jgi:acyl-CoA synthetase (AMP-forming)/AMP-acid ligase II
MTRPIQQHTSTIVAALADLAQNSPGRLVLVVARKKARGRSCYEEVSAGDLERHANTFAAMFAHHGIQSGMRTVVMIPPGREFCAAVFALLKLGAPPVFIDPAVGPRTVGDALRQSMPAAFIGSRKAQMARRIFGWGRNSIRISLTIESSSERLLKERSELDAYRPAAQSSDGIAAIAFTSGSTGPPKAVSFDHENLCAQADLLREILGTYATEPHLATFPLFLIFAGVLGVTAVLPEMDMSRPALADPAELISAGNDYKCRTAFASPVLVRKLGSYSRETSRRFSTLQCMLSAGAPSDPDALAAMEGALAPGGEVFTPYGATEALLVSNLGSREILRETREKTRQGAGICVGRPLHGMTATVIAINDRSIEAWSAVSPLPSGEIGEIAVSGRVVSREYFNCPETTMHSKIPCRTPSGENSFFHRMGDLGYLDDLGRLWMCGRKSHRVVAPKCTYFTVPVEGVFNGHPKVARTALVGVTGEVGEIVPVLCVELAARTFARARRQITRELRTIGQRYEQTRDIHDFLYHRSFPVDARHNSKIRREELAIWAAKNIGKPKLESKRRVS